MKRTIFQLIPKLEQQLSTNHPYPIPTDELNDLIFDLLELGAYTCGDILEYFPITECSLAPSSFDWLTIYQVDFPSTIKSSPFSTWTTNFNFALRLASRQELGGTIYQGKVSMDKLLAYVSRRNVFDIIVYTADVQEIIPLPAYTHQDLPHLLSPTLINRYHYFSDQLNDDWFAQKSKIHGREHTLRVLLFALMINELEDLQAEKILAYCALLHDIGRINDNADPCHGQQAVNRLIEEDINLPDITEEELEIIKFIIINHSIDDKQVAFPDNPKVINLLWAFKDADNLDRVRVTDLDVTYLRTPTAIKLPAIAQLCFCEHQFI